MFDSFDELNKNCKVVDFSTPILLFFNLFFSFFGFFFVAYSFLSSLALNLFYPASWFILAPYTGMHICVRTETVSICVLKT
jgi:hypothetical protein